MKKIKSNLFYELDLDLQRKKLIDYIKKHNIKVLNEDNVDRFKLVGKTLTIEKVVERLKKVLKNLK